jgi:hypothetical protein
MSSTPPHNNSNTKKRKREERSSFLSPTLPPLKKVPPPNWKDGDKQKSAHYKDCLLWNSHLPTDILHNSIFQCLTVQDLTTLAATSHTAATSVDQFRGPRPYIVKEELWPTKMLMVNFSHRADRTLFDHHSLRTLRFLLATNHHGKVMVQFRIGNYLWSEGSAIWIPPATTTRRPTRRNNPNHPGEEEDEEDPAPSSTWVEVKIYQQQKKDHITNQSCDTTTTSGESSLLFETLIYNPVGICTAYYLAGYKDNPWDIGLALKNPETFEQTRHERLAQTSNTNKNSPPPSVVLDQKCCVEYFWTCAKRIAKSPSKYNLPSLEHLILKALPECLYQYLPPLACKQQFGTETVTVDLLLRRASKNSNNTSIPLWKHRFPPTPEVRAEFLQPTRYAQGQTNNNHSNNDTGEQQQDQDDPYDQYGQWAKECYIYDIPWYQDWYPKPVLVHPKYCWESMPPDIVGRSILPFLTLQDRSHLATASPNMVGRVLGCAADWGWSS